MHDLLKVVSQKSGFAQWAVTWPQIGLTYTASTHAVYLVNRNRPLHKTGTDIGVKVSAAVL